MMKTKFLITLICFVFIVLYSSGLAAQTRNNYLVVLSMDGFRWDYPDSFPTPNLDLIAKKGVKAKSLIPSFPSVTFPNHYTLATGLYPDHHGIVHNDFYDSTLHMTYKLGDRVSVEDGRFYGGEPIWNTAEKQDVKAATFFWVGSEADVQAMHPSYWKKYDKTITFEQRVDTVIHWLSLPEKDRPHLIMFYFDEPDHAGHSYGPFAPETRNMVMRCDSMVGLFMQKLNKLPIAGKVNFIATSDHGMGAISDSRRVNLDDYIKLNWAARVDGSNPVVMLEPKQGCTDSILNALKDVKHIRVWKKSEIPAYLHFGTNPRVDDIVVCADSAWSISSKTYKPLKGGTHGYDPRDTDIHAIFYACGPAFKAGYVSPSFENVDIYPLMSYLLGITPKPSDGSLKGIKRMLKQ